MLLGVYVVLGVWGCRGLGALGVRIFGGLGFRGFRGLANPNTLAVNAKPWNPKP